MKSAAMDEEEAEAEERGKFGRRGRPVVRCVARCASGWG